MIYRIGNNRKIGAKPKFILSIATMLIILCILLITALQGLFKTEIKGNLVYVQMLNYSMPTVKSTIFDSEDLVESSLSLKGKFMDFMGIGIGNPLNIVSKEIAYFSMLDKNNLDIENTKISFNSFNLEDSSILKNEAGSENKSSSQGEDNKVVNVYDPNLKKKLDSSKPEVFIYHTHTSESYAPGPADSSDESKNVCAVGDELAKELETNFGISVIHDKTMHSTSYNGSYTRSRETLTKYLNKYGDFKLIIDLHRDSVLSKNSVTAKLNGEDVAKIMFVMTKKNPHFNKNNEIATQMLDTSKKLFPGLDRGIMYYETGTKYFNQDLSNNAILIEVGANINTTDEAKGSAKYMARLISEYLKTKN